MKTAYIRTTRLLATLLNSMALLLLCACQHTQLQFEPVTAPVLADFSLRVPDDLPPFPLIRADMSNVSLHRIDELTVDFRLNGAYLVLTTPATPIKNADLLARALGALARLSAIEGDACAEALTIKARLHSLSFFSPCDSPDTLKQRADSLMNGIGQLSDREFDRIVREQKLARHIEAFTGSDIDRLWAQIVLGKSHPYLDYNKPFTGDKSTLEQGMNRLKSQARWQLLGHKLPATLPADSISAVKPQHTPQRPQIPRLLTPVSTGLKQLYLLDAPGQVQAQVRLGYALAPEGNNRTCMAMAALLGRSQSGRLFYDLRSQRGLTYGVYGSCIDNPLSRTLKFYGASANESTGAFVRGIVDHLALLANDSATTAELDALESFLAGQQKLTADSPGSAIVGWLEALERGLQMPEVETLPPDRAALTEFGSLILSQPPLIVLKGDAAKIAEDLQAKLPGWQLNIINSAQ